MTSCTPPIWDCIICSACCICCSCMACISRGDGPVWTPQPVHARTIASTALFIEEVWGESPLRHVFAHLDIVLLARPQVRDAGKVDRIPNGNPHALESLAFGLVRRTHQQFFFREAADAAICRRLRGSCRDFPGSGGLQAHIDHADPAAPGSGLNIGPAAVAADDLDRSQLY